MLRNSIVLPSGADTQHSQFDGIYVGVAIVNLSPGDNQVSGRDSDGNEQFNQQLQRPLAGQGQDAFLTDELTGANGELSSLVAQGDQGPIQEFSMLGDYEGRHLDGVGGALVAATTLYFPLARHWGEEETTLFFYSTTPTSWIRLCCCACARPTARCCKRLPSRLRPRVSARCRICLDPQWRLTKAMSRSRVHCPCEALISWPDRTIFPR